MPNMPEIKSNMLLEFVGGVYLVVVNVPVRHVYNVYRLRLNDRGELCVYDYVTLSYSDIAVSVQRIYGVVAGSEYAPLNMAELRGLLKGEPWANRLIWERPAVKEVTMAEVCEKFGCTVKIVKG